MLPPFIVTIESLEAERVLKVIKVMIKAKSNGTKREGEVDEIDKYGGGRAVERGGGLKDR